MGHAARSGMAGAARRRRGLARAEPAERGTDDRAARARTAAARAAHRSPRAPQPAPAPPTPPSDPTAWAAPGGPPAGS